jgi:hypothetical protein
MMKKKEAVQITSQPRNLIVQQATQCLRPVNPAKCKFCDEPNKEERRTEREKRDRRRRDTLYHPRRCRGEEPKL